MRKSLIFVLCSLLVVGCKQTAEQQTSPIRLNQVGYAPLQEMTATIVLPDSTVDAEATSVVITNADNDTVWTGVPAVTLTNPISGKRCQIVNFSALDEEGEYTMIVNNPSIQNTPITQKIIIRNHPYRDLTRAALRAFYYQRASMDIEEPYAEGFARKAGHPDDHVLVHASAATAERPEGTVISSPGGWYDAGDYNKYIVNSGYTMGVWLMSYELNKAYFDTLNLNIPESQMVNGKCPDGKCPDMLLEAMYNIRWMMTMQDLDGGVYHKLTTPNFEKFIRPDECQQQRYVVLKTTAATLDFAATLALAARVYAPYDPAFCAQAKEAATRAYAWAQAHPAVYYDQPALNEQIVNDKMVNSPLITTGAYDDFDVTDEFYWAATELYLLTHEEKWLNEINKWYMVNDQMVNAYTPAVWGNVAELADLEWMMHSDLTDELGYGATLVERLCVYLEPFITKQANGSVFVSPYGNSEEDFFWGCNSEGCCWRGIECLYAFHFTGDDRYFAAAQACLNYILGQNATGYCYVTGFGSNPSSHPHHRLSYSHPKGTHPGFLVGGPNRERQDAVTDGVIYPENVPADESYLDEQPSYASNEVTINWNVTLFALSGGIDAWQ